MVDDGGEVVSLHDSRTIHVCICTRVSDQPQYMDLQTLFEAMTSEDAEEELQDTRVAKRDPPGNYNDADIKSVGGCHAAEAHPRSPDILKALILASRATHHLCCHRPASQP